MKTTIMKLVNVFRIAFFVIGVLVFFTTTRLFNGCHRKPVVAVAPATMNIAPVVTEDMTAIYRQRITQLEAERTELSKKVVATTHALTAVKRDNKALQAQLEEQIITSLQLSDTTALLNNCDSIKQIASDLLQSSAEKDSLYDALATSLQQKVDIQDSTIQIQSQQYAAIQMNYSNALAAQQTLLDQNLLCQKQLRKRKIGNKLLSFGLAALAGTTTYLLLSR
ncbi:MAG TPA: hypothetical protein VM802_10160 [Chitinophaga sp.]|uniref:hypothetical protein n=1 Tax=Chitinophaga sp. TaxID=1869181 RepID=UPI002B91EB91|nr:hypothetical protein [Chitinophaga sp.]HVI45226.1 hypothetical protein [Chitinophaga sp.]